MARQQPPQAPPPVQRLRLRYAKIGPARFASHRDFSRAFERALRRAEVPMAYSSGFNPHPRISYANASPTSAATEAEYVEIALSADCDPDAVMTALNEAMPPGMPIRAVAEAKPGTSLGDLLLASRWQLSFPEDAAGLMADAVERLRASDAVEVERETKRGTRRFDVLASIVSIDVAGCVVTVVTTHDVPLVRPDDVVSALRQVEPNLPTGVLFTRLAQGRLGPDGSLNDPFS